MDEESASKEILLVNAFTDGSTPSGTFTLTGDLIVTGQSKIVIPKGMTLKAWARSLSGLGEIAVNWRFANDGTTFRTLFTDVLQGTEEEFSADYASRPRAFRSSAGTETVQVTYSNATTGGTVSSVALNLEFSED